MGSKLKSSELLAESRALRYLVAAIMTLAALGLRMLLDPVLRDQATYLTFFLAVLASSRFGGFLPGALTTVLGALALDWFYIEPLGSLVISSSKAMSGLTLFCLAGLIISLVVGRLRRSLIAATNSAAPETKPGEFPAEVLDPPERQRSRRPHLVWLGFALLLVATEGMLFYGTWARLSERGRLYLQTRQVLEQITAVFSAMQDAETGQRGYLLTGTEAYLKPYDDAKEVVSLRLDELRKLASETPEQQKRVADLRMLITAKLNVIKTTIELRKTRGAAAALEVVQTDTGKRLMDRIRERVAAMRTAELSRLELRDRSLLNAATGMAVIMLSGSGLLLLVLLAGARAINRHISERAKSEEMLRRSEERFRVVQELSPDGFNILQPVRDGEGRITDFTFLYQNPESARRAGNERNAVLGRTLSELYPSFRGSQFGGVYREVADRGGTRILEAPIDFGDSSSTWLRAVVVRMGQDIAVLTQDITERKRAEETITETSALLEAILNSIPIPVMVSGSAGNMVRCNKALASIYHIEENAIEGYSSTASLTTEDGADVPLSMWPLARVLRGEQINNLDLLLTYKNETRNMRYFGDVIRDPNGAITHGVLALLDLTDQKRAERDLREANAQLEAILESIPDPVTVSDAAGNVVLNNAACHAVITQVPNLYDFVPYAELRTEDGQLVPPEMWPVSRAIRGERLRDLHLWVRFNDAPARLYRYSTNSICDGDGKVTHAIICQIDITDRKRVEERLRASEEKFAKAFAVNPAAVAMTRVADGLFVDVNAAWEAMTGYHRDEVAGRLVKRFRIWPAPEDRDRFTAELKQNGAIQGWEQRFLKKSGEPYTALFSAVMVNVGGEDLVLSTLLDVTEQKKAAEALRQLNQQLEQRVEERTAQLVEAGEKVRAERQRFLEMLDTLPVIVAIIRQDHRVEWTNRAYRQALGDNGGHFCYAAQFGWNEPCEECEAFLPLETGQPHNWEWTLPNGRTFDIHNFPFAAEDGTPAVLEMDLDITERRRAEEVLRDSNATLEKRVAERTTELQASEDRFRTLANAIPQLCWTAKADGWIDWYNERWYQYTGTTPQDMAGWGWQSVHDPEALPAVMERWQESIATGEPFDMVFPLRGGDGAFRPFLTRVMPLVDGDGKIARWFGTNTDISEQRRAEDALRTQAELLRLSFDAIIVWYFDGAIESWNEGAEKLYGFSESEAMGQGIHDLLATVFPAPWQEIRAELVAKGFWEGELRRRTRGGDEVIVSVRKQLFRDAKGVARVLDTNRDITREKSSQEALLTSNIRFRSIFENSAAGIIIADWDGRFLETNGAFCALLGDTRDGLRGRHFSTLIPPPDLELNLADLRRLKNGEIQYFQNESRFIHKDGQAVWVHKFVSLIPDASGKGANVVAIVTDISERKRAEAAFRESEQRVRTLGDNLPNGAIYRYRLDTGGKPHVDFISAGIERITGFSATEFMADADVVNQSLVPEDRDRLRTAIESSRDQLSQFEVEVRHKHRTTGEIRWSLLRSTPSRLPDGSTAWDGIEIDVTERKLAEEARAQTNALLETILDSIPEPVMVMDVEGHLVRSNHVFESRHLITAPRTVEQYYPAVDVFTEDGHPVPPEMWPQNRVIKGERIGVLTLRLTFRNGGPPRFYRYSANPVYDGNGRVTHGVVVFFDVTENKLAEMALRDSEQRYRGLFESMQEAFMLGEMIFDEAGKPSDWRYLDVNPYFETIYGRKREQVVGKTYREVLPGPYSDYWLEVAGRVTLSGKGETFARNSNTGLHLEGTVYCPGPGQFAAIVTDATARRRAEEQLQQAKSELEVRVRERTTQLEASNKELEAFAYSVSHDLRSPLRGIDGWSLALVEDYAKQLDDTALEYLDRVRSEAQRMGMLIDDMLQLSRITRSQMQHLPIDLTSIAQTVVGRLRESHRDRKIEFDISAGLTGKGDAGLMDIALTNLLGNAVKFTRQREEARIEFGMMDRAGERVFFVRDNGVGFNMASAGKLFGAFQRLHKASQFPGTGIGLATVQRIVHRHGGRVWAEAERGKGATFYFTLESQ